MRQVQILPCDKWKLSSERVSCFPRLTEQVSDGASLGIQASRLHDCCCCCCCRRRLSGSTLRSQSTLTLTTHSLLLNIKIQSTPLVSFITVLLLIFNICKYKTLKITFSIGNIRQNTNHAKNVNKESKELNGMRGQLQLAIPRRAFFRSHAAVSYPLSGVLHRDTQIS